MTNSHTSQLRIRDNGTVKRIQLPKDKQEKLNMVLSSKRYASNRDKAVKHITGRCCICDNIPMYAVVYDIQQATRIEKYCDKCVQTLYARKSVL